MKSCHSQKKSILWSAYGEGHMAGDSGWPLEAEGDLQPTNRQQKTEALFSMTKGTERCQQNHVSEEVDPSPDKPRMRTSPSQHFNCFPDF